MANKRKEKDLKDILGILTKYKLVIVLITLLPTLTSWYYSSYIMTPIYEASTEIIVNNIENSQKNVNDINTELKLMSTYIGIIKSPRIIDLVIDEYDLYIDTNDLINRIKINTIADSKIMEIVVEDSNQYEAARIANEIVTVFTREIIKIMSVDNVQIITEAKTLNNPIPVKPNVMLITLLAFILGLLLAIILVFLIEYFDDTLKTEEDVEVLIGYSLFGSISPIKLNANEMKYLKRLLIADRRTKFKKSEIKKMAKLITLVRPNSKQSEAFKMIRTNIQFSETIKTFMITSTSTGEGKSTIISNLAVALAQTDKKVLLVDADLRDPIHHQYFYLSNETGLTSILMSSMEIDEVIFETSIPNLYILPSGPIPTNPTELLSTNKMKELVNSLFDRFDYVLYDTPAINNITDAIILSHYIDRVLFVVKKGVTKGNLALKAKGVLDSVKANIMGVIINHKD